MASVRMCDRCGTVFSERADGWGTFTGSVRKRDADGKWTSIQDTLDSCPECTELMSMPQTPALATSPHSALPGEAIVRPSYEDQPQG